MRNLAIIAALAFAVFVLTCFVGGMGGLDAFAGNPALDTWAAEGECAKTFRDIRNNIQICNNTGDCRVMQTCRAMEATFGVDLKTVTATQVRTYCVNAVAVDHPRMSDALWILDRCDRLSEGAANIANSVDQ
jgi:hypothetical protein